MKSMPWRKVALWTGRVVASLLLLAVVLPLLLYIPAVQTLAKDIAVSQVKKSTGIDIGVRHLRVRFPLRVDLEGVSIVEPDAPDTLLQVGVAKVDVAFWPLLHLDVQARHLDLEDVDCRLGTIDSLLCLRARVERACFDSGGFDLKNHEIAVDHALVEGINVRLDLREDTAATPPDTARPEPLRIRAREIELRRLAYTMTLRPIIDSIGATVPQARLRDGLVDIGASRVHARLLEVDSVSAAYLADPAGYYSTAPPDTAAAPFDPSSAWTVTADSLRLTARSALYGIAGHRPAPGLDPEWIRARDISVSVDSFRNRGVEVRVPVRQLTGTLLLPPATAMEVEASGLFDMDAGRMRVEGFQAMAGRSQLNVAEAMMGMGDLAEDPTVPLLLRAYARLYPADLAAALPSVVTPQMASRLNGRPLTAGVDAQGCLEALEVTRLDINAFSLARLSASGAFSHLADPARAGGRLSLQGSIGDAPLLVRLLPSGLLPAGVTVPPLTLDGDVAYSPGLASGTLRATASGGTLAADARWEATARSYRADIGLHAFPVGAFMPSLGIGRVTGTLKAAGRGYNPLSAGTALDLALNVESLQYQGRDLGGVHADATLSGGHATGSVASGWPMADLDITFDATIASDSYTWSLDGDIRHLDLEALHLAADTCRGSLSLVTSGSYNPRDGSIDATLDVRRLAWQLPSMPIDAQSLSLDLESTPAQVMATLLAPGVQGRVTAECPLDTLLGRVAAFPAVADTLVRRRVADVAALQRALPPMQALVDVDGSAPLVSGLLSGSGLGLGRASLELRNDSLLQMQGSLTRLSSGTLALDSISLNAYQRGATLVYSAAVENSPGTLDNFAHMRLNGFLAENRLSAFLNLSDISGRPGFKVGLLATMADSTLTARIIPRNPTLAYREFTVNDSNYISWNLDTHRLTGDLSLTDGSTLVRLYTTGSGDTADPEELVADIRNLQLADYLSLLPEPPPVQGTLQGRVRLKYAGGLLTGRGSVGLDNLKYDRQRVGSFDAGFDLATDPVSGLLRANLDLMVDSVKTLTLSGVLNDSTATTPLSLDLRLTRFPLALANPFLPPGTATLEGWLNGAMTVTGQTTDPDFDGYLAFEDAAATVTILGTRLALPAERIPVTRSVVAFDDYAITALNDNPLTINGTVDLTTLASGRLDLNLYASDIMVVNSQRAKKGADVYGKGYLDINADVKGSLDRLLRASAQVTLLPGSNVTYVMPSAAAALQTANYGDMVHFVSFADTTAVAQADSLHHIGMALLLDAQLTLAENTTVGVDLSANGSDRAQLQPQGTLTYTLTPVSERLAGRLNINGGFVRYTPPLLSEKYFTFSDGSYVSFTGDMLNPALHIVAVDQMRANVTRSGENSRMVNFDVTLTVTGTLESLNVAFDLASPDDVTIANELASMSPDQRASSAMNLLLYGVYSVQGTSATANLGGNLLYSFLESTLNNWMASNIKGVDITFGIEQYDKTYNGSTSTATNYSYHVSKTLFNDRFKIVVGGTYSTDNEGSDESVAEALFNDISAEYMLNRAGTMYVKIFRKSDFESILEGEVIQTGVGFVYRRRLTSLRDMFRFRRSAPASVPAPAPAATPDTTARQ